MVITSIALENVKRIKALRLEPSPDGLTVIGGNNGQGKTSVLDAIAYALGGEKYRPSNLKREGAVGDPIIHIETDDGLVIDRKGKNSSLTVTDKDGRRGGQQILDSIVNRLAIDLPKFLNANAKEKANTLLQILGIGDQLDALDRKEKSLYDTRLTVGRMAEQKKKAAEDMPYHENAPKEPLSIAELIKKQSEILARNGVKQKLAADLEANRRSVESYQKQIDEMEAIVERLEADIIKAEKEDLTLESTDELERQIADFEKTNALVAENAAKIAREDEAADLQDQYEGLTAQIEAVRKERAALLEGAELPYPGLTVENGELKLDGKSWDCMSGSQQKIVATAIAAKLKPDCKFVLLVRLEEGAT